MRKMKDNQEKESKQKEGKHMVKGSLQLGIKGFHIIIGDDK